VKKWTEWTVFGRRLTCLLGLHEWERNLEAFQPTSDKREVVIGWDQCPKCGESCVNLMLR